ncbi:MAG: DUF11 domain-containing protein [Aestuariibacter sp.]|nr:DUF11 domain-containing protein [Aestuariibacter sp.]
MATTTLALSKTAADVNGSPLVVGDTIRYTLQVTNTGSYTAYNVIVTDTLPVSVTYVSDSGGAATTGPNPLVWTIAELAPSNTVSTLYITVTINTGTEGQEITNTATVTGSNIPTPPPPPTPVCPDGSPEPCDPGSTPVATTTLALSKTAADVNGSPLVVGDTIRYTVQVTNTGSYTAYNVIVTDTLPVSVTLVSSATTTGNISGSSPIGWNVGNIATNTVQTLYITVTLNADTVGQSITNTATVTSSNVTTPPGPSDPVCPDGSVPIGVDCSSSGLPIPTTITLAFSKSAADIDGAPLLITDTIRYTLLVTNTDSYTAFNVVVTDTLPVSMTLVSSSTLYGTVSGTSQIIWNIGDVLSGDTATMVITTTLQADTSGQFINNVASAQADNTTRQSAQICPDNTVPASGVCNPAVEPDEESDVYLPIIILNN